MTKLKATKMVMPTGDSKPKRSMEGFVGRLKGRSKKVATLEEISEGAANGWAGVKRKSRG